MTEDGVHHFDVNGLGGGHGGERDGEGCWCGSGRLGWGLDLGWHGYFKYHTIPVGLVLPRSLFGWWTSSVDMVVVGA
jgi:hypothetical protein